MVSLSTQRRNEAAQRLADRRAAHFRGSQPIPSAIAATPATAPVMQTVPTTAARTTPGTDDRKLVNFYVGSLDAIDAAVLPAAKPQPGLSSWWCHLLGVSVAAGASGALFALTGGDLHIITNTGESHYQVAELGVELLKGSVAVGVVAAIGAVARAAIALTSSRRRERITSVFENIPEEHKAAVAQTFSAVVQAAPSAHLSAVERKLLATHTESAIRDQSYARPETEALSEIASAVATIVKRGYTTQIDGEALIEKLTDLPHDASQVWDVRGRVVSKTALRLFDEAATGYARNFSIEPRVGTNRVADFRDALLPLVPKSFQVVAAQGQNARSVSIRAGELVYLAAHGRCEHVGNGWAVAVDGSVHNLANTSFRYQDCAFNSHCIA